MATYGPNDLKSISLPSAWDPTELQRLKLRDGATYAEILRDINGALELARDEVLNGPIFDLVHITDEVTVEYRVGVSNGFEDHTEYGRPDSKRGETTGHMLPIKKLDRGFGWTNDFLEEARRVRIDADIASAIQDYKDALEKGVLVRLFNPLAETGRAVGLGGSGKSVPLADGGTADSTYVPVPMTSRAGAFAYTHTHFLRLNGITQANLETAVDHIWEHGHDAPYDLLAAEADIASWQNVTNITGFVKRDYGLVTWGSDVSLAQVNDRYLGVITTKRGPVRLWTSARVPTKYWSVYKTYGRDDKRNPIWMRYDPLFGRGPKLISENVSRYPLHNAYVQVKHGFGIGEDRVSAVCVLNDTTGSYSQPTIS